MQALMGNACSANSRRLILEVDSVKADPGKPTESLWIIFGSATSTMDPDAGRCELGCESWEFIAICEVAPGSGKSNIFRLHKKLRRWHHLLRDGQDILVDVDAVRRYWMSVLLARLRQLRIFDKYRHGAQIIL